MVSLKLLTVLSSIIACAIAQTKLRYMPFGDSITEIICWRRYLYQHLQTAGITNVDFVGGQTTATTGCTANDYDRNHEGHSGFQAVNIANQNQLVGWLNANPADIITMHLGTNDINGGRSTTDITTAFSKLVDQMRASNPKMRIIVALIIPFPPQSAKVTALNQAIPAWAASKNSTASPIWIVDQYTGFSSSDLRDGVHPNDSGDKKMEAKWYPAIVTAINSLKANATTMVGLPFSG